MNTIISCSKFQPAHLLNQNEINNVLIQLSGFKGIKSLDVEPGSVTIEYSPYSLTSEIIKDALVKAKFPFKTKSENIGFLRKFILGMGEENNKQFGGKPPSCCSNH